ncbi:MAG: glycosyltransferase family 2 protein, partial [bacterium]
MSRFFTSLIVGFNDFVGVYYVILNSVYTILLASAIIVILRHIRRIRYSPFHELAASSQMPPISVLVPAFNEATVISRAVRSLMTLNYPSFEIIVINDGSEDQTLPTLIRNFRLRKIDLVYRAVIKSAAVKGFYCNPEIPNLVVVDKERGGKADALNCGINVSRCPFVCSVDADSIFESDSLIRLMTP